MGKKTWLILIAILLLGFVIRAFKINSLPLYGDELTLVYDSYSILKTGQDQTGIKFPITFPMRGGSPGGYVYFSVPFVALFGPTGWGVRSLSLLSGLGMIVLMYFLGKRLFNEKTGIFASLLMSLSPWDIYLSRGGFETHFALFLALFGILMFLNKKYIWWAIAWGISIFTYPTFKLTLPLIFLLLVWFSGLKNVISNKSFRIGIIVLALFGSLVIREYLISNGEQRFLSINIFADQNLKENIIQRVNYERTVSTLPVRVRPIFINRGIEYSRLVFENYVKSLSPEFLFLRGDGNPRHNPGEMGMFYLVDLPLVFLGIIFLLKEKRRELTLLSFWILIAPLATMLFVGTHALRGDLMLIPFLLLIAFALSKISKKYLCLFISLILIQLIYILIRIYTIAPAKFASFWSAEAKEVALLAKEADKNGQKVKLNVTEIDNIEYAYEVYAEIDPKLVIEQAHNFPKVYGNVTITDK